MDANRCRSSPSWTVPQSAPISVNASLSSRSVRHARPRRRCQSPNTRPACRCPPVTRRCGVRLRRPIRLAIRPSSPAPPGSPRRGTPRQCRSTFRNQWWRTTRQRVGVKVTATEHFTHDDRVVALRRRRRRGRGHCAAGRRDCVSGRGGRRFRPRFARRRAGRNLVGLVVAAGDHGHNDHDDRDGSDRGRDLQPGVSSSVARPCPDLRISAPSSSSGPLPRAPLNGIDT